MSAVNEIKRNFDVYPGHPAIVALCILLNWEDNLPVAFTKHPTDNYPPYLTNGDIPGAGGNVSCGAHYLVEYMRGCLPLGVVLTVWDKAWEDYTRDGYQKYRADGQKKSEMLRPLLIKKMRRAKTKWHRFFGYFGV